MLLSASTHQSFYVVAALLAVTQTPARSYAQEMVPEDEPAVPHARITDAEQWSRLIDEAFDRHFVGKARAGELRAMFERILSRKINDADRKYQLSSEHRHKLEVAGHGDIDHFFDLVEEQRQTLIQYSTLARQPLGSNAELSAMILNEELGNVLGDRSLFAKTLSRIRSAQNSGRPSPYQLVRYRQAVEPVVNYLRKDLKMTDSQQTQLLTLILSETEPLNRYGQLDAYAVLYQVSTLPPPRLETILDDQQRQSLGRLFALAAVYKEQLVAEAYLPRQTEFAQAPDPRAKLRLLNQQMNRAVEVKP